MSTLFLVVITLIMVLATDSEYSVVDTISVYGVKKKVSNDDKKAV